EVRRADVDDEATAQPADQALVDDMQFLTGRRETQSELLRLLNSLQGSGRQIIMTSDRPPAEIADVDERLISRLSGGLIVDIGAPDFETRVAILREKCEERRISFAPGVLEELARVEFANVRELQGAMNRLNAHQSVDGTLLPGQVRSIVGMPEPAPAPARTSVETDEFFSFLTDIASAVAAQIEPWKVRIGEAIAYWGGEGYRTTVLDRMMAEGTPPDNYEQLLRGYGQAVEQLRELERQVTTVDPALGGDERFRDPERLSEAMAFVEYALAGTVPPGGPQPAFARRTYEESSSNQMAVRAADAVIAEPGHRYNPLFLVGPSGVGKTHLLNAIGNELASQLEPPARVACVGAQLFIDELIVALQEGTIERFRARYRAADALLIDDVQFVASKERTQEELFHVFNYFHSAGKQLVFASDVAPKAIQGLEDRLRSRFEGGLVAEVGLPDRALREKLYSRFLKDAKLAAPRDLLGYLADRPTTSVREIMGTVQRLRAGADVSGAPLTLALGRQVLEPSGMTPTSAPLMVRQAADSFFLDDEKIVWEWPDVAGRLVEELR
ncbi:MAG: bacterial DnaA family protein, partial [Gemmatimonadetes bacterium]|nr:bacterial DnaA family protein [Gemmatimonadota bacterium]